MNCLQQRFAIQFCGMGILPVPVLLAGKMPAPQEILDISLILTGDKGVEDEMWQ
jgi:hypothetical protein